MAPQDSPRTPPAGERRRAERVRPGPLRVRLHRLCEGSLVDISELGALVRLPTAQSPEKQINLQLEWQDATLVLRGRVVRSTSYRVELPSAVLQRTEHLIAVEFRDLPANTVERLEQMIREHRSRPTS